MTIVGHGVDLVDVTRIARMLDDHKDQFLTRCFTPAEAAGAGEGRGRAEHFAGRFAAKEAVLKALGTGLSQGIHWTDIEVLADGAGRPHLRLSGVALQIAERLGARSWWVSISHTADFASASVIAEG